jgi:RNA polymerase sigma-70 factor, ECF subfamily
VDIQGVRRTGHPWAGQRDGTGADARNWTCETNRTRRVAHRPQCANLRGMAAVCASSARAPAERGAVRVGVTRGADAMRTRDMLQSSDADLTAPKLSSDRSAPGVVLSEMPSSTVFPRPSILPSHRPESSSPAVLRARGDVQSASVDASAEELTALRDSRSSGPLRRARTALGEHAERRIARRLAKQDPAALAEVHELTGRAAFSVILGIVRDRGHAEDVHQQVFAEVWRRAAQFDPVRGSLLTWVLTIARSRALDHVRRRADQATDPEVLAALGGGADDPEFESIIDRALIGEALARIPEQERELLRLRFWEGLSQTEIADRTGQPLGTVKSRMLAGLRNVKLQLEMQGAA